MRFNIVTFRVVAGSVTGKEIGWRTLQSALTDPGRALTDGFTVGALAGAEFERLATDIRESLDATQRVEERLGFAYVLTMLALRAGLSYKGRYGSPWWPDVVAAFIEQVGDPPSPLRSGIGSDNSPPRSVSDGELLTRTLLEDPELLDDDGIYWCLRNGFVRPAAFRGFARWRSRRDPDWVDPLPWLSEA